MTKQSLIDSLRDMYNETNTQNDCHKFFVKSANLRVPKSKDKISYYYEKIRSSTRKIVSVDNKESNIRKKIIKEILKEIKYNSVSDNSHFLYKIDNIKNNLTVRNIFSVMGFAVLSAVCFIAGMYSLKIKIEILRNILLYGISFVFFFPLYLVAFFSPVFKIFLGICALFENILFIMMTNETVTEFLIEFHKLGPANRIALILLILVICIPAIAFGIGYFYLIYKKYY